MNIRTICIFPQGRRMVSMLTQGNFLWMPLCLADGLPQMDEACVVFNIRRDNAVSLAEKKSQPYYCFTDMESEGLSGLPESLPREPIEQACALADRVLENHKQLYPRYREKFKYFLERSLRERSSGFNDWVLRGLLYRGLTPLR